MAKQNLIYAMKGNTIVGISEVESGKKCGCTCPSCGEPLVARKGKKIVHHFAHWSGHSCEYGYETSLHLAAKDILSKTKKLVIPPVDLHFPNSGRSPERLSEAMEIEIDRVELEKSFDTIVPDVVAYSGSKKFFIEVFVTHAVDEKKLEKIRNADISTIEIDLSKKLNTISSEELEEILIGDSPAKKWVYNSYAEKCYKLFLQAADKREFSKRGLAMHIDDCPLQMREWHGKVYANFIDDCIGCEYCILYDETGVYCTGAQRIGSMKDFLQLSEKRKGEAQ